MENEDILEQPFRYKESLFQSKEYSLVGMGFLDIEEGNGG